MTSITPSYSVYPVARELIRALDDGDELIAVYGGMRSGKTWAITQACLTICQTRKAIDLDTGTTRPIEIVITRSTQGQIKASFGPPFRAIIEPVGGQLINEPGNVRWIMPNGSIIHWRAYTLHSTRGESESSIEGLGFSVIFGDESTQYPDPFFHHSLERTSEPSINIYTNTVYEGSQTVWLSRPAADTRFLDIAREHHRAGMKGRVIYSQTRDVMTDAYMRKLAIAHPKAIFEALTQDRIGATMPVKGAVYSDWQAEDWPNGNLIDLPVQLDHPTYVSIDPGVNTTSVLFIQHHSVHGHPLAVVVDEWHPDIATSTQDIVREVQRRGYTIAEVIIDPAADARSRSSSLTSEAAILGRGVDVDPDGLGPGLGAPVRASIPAARRGVKEGIYRVMARVCAADGTRSLVAHRRLWDDPQHDRGLRFSLQNYSWDPVSGEPRKGSKGKHSDHCMDALRYYVCHHGWRGPPDLGQSTPTPRTSPPIPPRRHAVSRRAHRAGDR